MLNSHACGTPIVRGDHQLNAGNTWGLRWLRETSPQPLQIQDTNHTVSRHEAETDVDWTLVGNLSSVIGSSKVNTFRVSAVSEDVFFGNPNFNSNGHDQKILLPMLDQLSFEDQQSNRANRRLDVAYGADNVFAWFLPNKNGDHDLKFGVNYLYSSLRVQDHGNMNGTFVINSDLPFDRNNPRTYPERLMIRVPGALNFLMKGHFIGMFAQDKWKMGNKLTSSLGARYDLEVLPTPNQDNPMFEDNPDGYPTDLNNFSPRVGLLRRARRRGAVGGAGRVRCVLSTHVLYVPHEHVRTGREVLEFVHRELPDQQLRPGPRKGTLPTDPRLINGPVVDHAAIDALYPARYSACVTAARCDSTTRIARTPTPVSTASATNVSSAPPIGLSIDFIRSEQRAQYVLKELNPLVRDRRSQRRPSAAPTPSSACKATGRQVC